MEHSPVAPAASASPTASSSPRTHTRTKAIVAIAAGAVLLLGGGTTLAYWSTSQVLDVGTINSGDLNMVTDGAPEWTLQGVTDAAATAVADPAAVEIVPGDVLTMTQDVTLTVQGDTLSAELTIVEGTVPEGLAAAVDATGVTPTAITAADDGKTVTVTVTITFDAATANREKVNTAFDLGDVTLTLSQLSA